MHSGWNCSADEKERAEHVMLVDLARNDMGRICTIWNRQGDTVYGSAELFPCNAHRIHWWKEEKKENFIRWIWYPRSFRQERFAGAPKIRAMEIIDELESVRRGLYGGATGYIDFSGDMDFCITIRTMIKKEKPCIFAGWSGNSCRFCSGK